MGVLAKLTQCATYVDNLQIIIGKCTIYLHPKPILWPIRATFFSKISKKVVSPLLSIFIRWAKKTGSEKFRYENVLPIFKKSQNAIGYGDDYYNGRDGLLKTAKNPEGIYPFSDLAAKYIKARSTLLSENCQKIFVDLL